MDRKVLVKNEVTIDGKHHREITLDVNFLESGANLPIIIFCHGFKGFKDWGTFNLMAETFARNNFIFVKFNFSYNGTSTSLARKKI